MIVALLVATMLSDIAATEQLGVPLVCPTTTKCADETNCQVETADDAKAWACLQRKSGRECWQMLDEQNLKRDQADAIRAFFADFQGAQCDAPRGMSSATWCADIATLCWKSEKAGLSGLRLLFEPAVAFPQHNRKNGNEIKSDPNLTAALGGEVNIYGAWLAVQSFFFLPSTIEFDEKSPIRARITSPNKRVEVDRGFALGASMLDGAVAAGVGWLWLDERDFGSRHRMNGNGHSFI